MLGQGSERLRKFAEEPQKLEGSKNLSAAANREIVPFVAAHAEIANLAAALDRRSKRKARMRTSNSLTISPGAQRAKRRRRRAMGRSSTAA